MNNVGNKVLLFFVDGLGIGEADVKKNPCASPELKLLNHFQNEVFPKKIAANGFACALDATLGVSGLPQSATGQTALLTGQNAAQILGYHHPGFPNEKLREIIYKHSILKKVITSGKTAAFINAYTPAYFEHGPEKLKRWLSVTSHATLASGFPFFTVQDVLNERSIYQEFTNQALLEKGLSLPIFSPEKAGGILARASANYDFSLYEYFQTDRAGHSGKFDQARNELVKVEQLLLTCLKNLDLETTTLIMTSDHGNIEDLSVHTHTKNPAMTLLLGAQAESLAFRMSSIQDVSREVLQLLNIQNTDPV